MLLKTQSAQQIATNFRNCFRWEASKLPDWQGGKVTIRGLAKTFNLPRDTLRKRINGEVVGYDHMSGGGKGKPKILTLVEESQSIHNA